LRLDTTELSNDLRVDQTDIREGSVITATLNNIAIKVKLHSETLELNVDPADPVSSIKD
jgi:hypothetical protein